MFPQRNDPREGSQIEWTVLSCVPVMDNIFFHMYGANSSRLERAISNIGAWNTSLGNWADGARGWEVEKTKTEIEE